MPHLQRIKKLQTKLRRKGIDALLVSQPENRCYLSGFKGGDYGISESAGLLLIPAAGDIHLLTDFRYKQQAEREVPWATIEIYPRGALKLLTELVPDLGLKKLAFEGHYTLFSSAEKMKTSFAQRDVQLIPLTEVIEKMREIKEESEIDLIRRSVRLNEEVFTTIFSRTSDFKTEIDLALAIESLMRKRGAEGASFNTIVASGQNSSLPHAVPGNSPIKHDKPLTIDMGLILNGYCSDMTRNFVPGRADKKYMRLHRLVRRAQLAGMAAIRAGVSCRDVDRAARTIINNDGYGKNFGHSLGHGVGLAVHEQPRLSSYSAKKLRPGMIVTVEPGIYIPGWGGIRLENMVVVREDGYENLNKNTTWLDI